MKSKRTLNIALAQIAPVWLDRVSTTDKIINAIREAATEKTELIIFGEALLPGYPFWLAHLGGAQWDTEINKTFHAHYMRQAVSIEDGHLDAICEAARQHTMSVYLGIIERPKDRGGKSIYASLVYIDASGTIQSVHRKLQPTYDERLTWAPGDGNGLQVHSIPPFTVGGLNCWENWMPLPRAALYGLGEDLHIAVWPGSDHNTKDITRFIARESRSFVVSVSALMHLEEVSKELPYRDEFLKSTPQQLATGGSCIAGPDGEWVLKPVLQKEGNLYATINHDRVFQER